jgi:hypothetical protein
MRLTGIAVLAAVVIVSARAGAVLADDNNTPVAVGDGFEVTQGEVEELISYTKLASFRSTEKQHIMAAVRIKVFAEEAKALGLGQAVETGEKEKDTETEVEKKTFGEQIKLSKRYIVKVLQDYPVSDLVIESYYRGHPDTIQEPLDEALKKRIRQKIVIAKQKAIIDRCFERLKEKYHVRFCDTEKGGCR